MLNQIEMNLGSDEVSSSMSKLKALLERLEKSRVYYDLSLTLKDEQERLAVQINQIQAQLNRKELLIVTVENNPFHVEALDQLAQLMQPEEQIDVLIDQQWQSLSIVDVLKRSLQNDLHNASGLFNLAAALEDQEQTVSIQIGVELLVLNKQALLISAIQVDPKYAKAYYNLALLLESEQTVSLVVNGQEKVFKKIDLFKEVICCEPDFLDAYFGLAFCLKNSNSTVDLVVDNRQLCLTKVEILQRLLDRDLESLLSGSTAKPCLG